MFETFFRAFLLIQPFFWMWVIEDKRFNFLNDDRIEAVFVLLTMGFMFFVGYLGIEIGFYSSELLILYAGMVGICFEVCVNEFNYPFKDSLGLGFLIVYLNSWYWEGILHIWAIQENGLNANQLFQLLHLTPAIYFLWKWKFEAKGASTELMKGWIFSGFITVIRKGRLWKYLPLVFTDLLVYQIDHGLMIVNRFICFMYLGNAIMKYGIQKKYIRDWRFGNRIVTSFINNIIG